MQFIPWIVSSRSNLFLAILYRDDTSQQIFSNIFYSFNLIPNRPISPIAPDSDAPTSRQFKMIPQIWTGLIILRSDFSSFLVQVRIVKCLWIKISSTRDLTYRKPSANWSSGRSETLSYISMNRGAIIGITFPLTLTYWLLSRLRPLWGFPLVILILILMKWAANHDRLLTGLFLPRDSEGLAV